MSTNKQLRSVIILHGWHGFTPEVIVPWLASFTELVGIVRIDEGLKPKVRRVYKEAKRSGVIGLLDAVAMRAVYKVLFSTADNRWLNEVKEAAKQKFGSAPNVPEIVVKNPNSTETEKFIKQLEPDIVIARCKFILKERIFSIPKCGTFVIHPGITPKYRNAHGCFWAMVNNDFSNIGITLLKVDRGIDTGPVLGHFYAQHFSPFESYVRLQSRLVWEHLDDIAEKLILYCNNKLKPIEIKEKKSKSQLKGQPHLSAWIKFLLANKIYR